MRKLEILPTSENVMKSFMNNSIGTNKSVCKFVTLLNSIENNYSIALEGMWGAGKTFFVKQVKMVLDAHNEYVKYKNDLPVSESEKEDIKLKMSSFDKNELKPQITVYYDAWQNDNDDDPILSIIYTILQSIDSDFKLEETANVLDFACAITTLLSRVDISSFKSNISSADLLEHIRKNKEIKKKIDEFIESLFVERGDRLIIFIDELDRCRPNFAVELLERIKHYFDNGRVTFVFSVNFSQLQHTISNCYGANFDGFRYLDRFFDLWLSVPKGNKNMFLKSIGQESSDSYCDEVVNTVMDMFSFTYREKIKYLNHLKLTVFKYVDISRGTESEYKAARDFCVVFIVPVMIGLKMNNIDKYYSFINGEDCSFLTQMFFKTYSVEELRSIVHRYLSRGESFYNENEKDRLLISEKIQEIYELITIPCNDSQLRFLGNVNFGVNIRDLIIEFENMLSDYTDFQQL